MQVKVSEQYIIRQNEDLNSFLDTLLFNVRHTEMTPEKRKERRELADKSDLDFAQIYFPNIFTLPYNDLHRHIASLKEGMYTIDGHRESGKSAAAYVMKAIKPLAEGSGGIVNINCKNQDDGSEERTAALVRLIKRNKLLNYDYDIKIVQDLKGYYIINDTHLVAGSVRKGLRNILDDDFQRIKIAINDDLTDKQSGEVDKRKAVDFIEYEVRGQLQKDGLSITLGNATDPDSPIVVLRTNHPETHFSFPALNEKGKSNWPEYRTKEDWNEFSVSIPWAVWQGDYMSVPCQMGGNFDPDWIRFVNFNLIKIICSISACDPGYGKSPQACFKSVSTLSYVSSNEIVMTDIYVRREAYELMFDYVYNLKDRIPNWKILLFENDFSQWTLAEPYYKSWSARTKKTIAIFKHFSKNLGTKDFGTDKESRILNLVHPHQSGVFAYVESLKGSHDFDLYKSQYIGFGASKEKLDGLDATATAFIMLPRWIERGSFKPLKEKKFGALKWFRK